MQFAGDSGFVGFSGVEVAGGAAVPESGARVFEVGAFLEEQFAVRGDSGRAECMGPGAGDSSGVKAAPELSHFSRH